tara:strand:- start:6913 stop:7944 length:1032 start_codon:yes stop_codon:yes gene_type:complete
MYFSLEDFQNIQNNMKMPYCLEPSIVQQIMDLNNIIEPIILENNQTHNYYSKKTTHTLNNHHRDESKQVFHKSSTSDKKQSYTNNGKKSDNNDKNWGRMAEFKTTQIEKPKEGIDKLVQDIRGSLNKISSKNYDSQKAIIVELLQQVYELDPELIKKVTTSFFDIASINSFYSEIYAKLYKELSIQYETFKDVIGNHIQNYTTGIKELKCIVDNETDYDAFCDSNKANDMRKALTVFIVKLMKQESIPKLRVLSIITTIQEIIVEKVEQENAVNEVEQLTELLFIFIKEGKDQFNEVKTEWIWKHKCVPMIQTFAKYKKNEKKSISSRCIFNYMDMNNLIQKN